MKILVADDSKIQAGILKKKLGKEHLLTVVEDGENAIEKLKLNDVYQVVLLDLQMPVIGGLDVLKYIRTNKLPTKVIVISGQERGSAEFETIQGGADYYMSKPTNMNLLEALLNRWDEELSERNYCVIKDGKEVKQPYKTMNKYCHICGYEHVKFHVSVEEGYEEIWNKGIFPVYESRNGYEPWDLLKSMVAVCPYCTFASSRAEDFADSPDEPFPYLLDAKKILSRSISTRKKNIGGGAKIDHRFDDPNRSPEQVLQSLQLAEKCMNGLILGGKEGAHSQLGFYNVLIGALDKANREQCYRNALESFKNQLKSPNVPGDIAVVSFYFSMAAHIALGNSVGAKGIMEQVSQFYQNRERHDSIEIERKWLKRISYIWENGVAANEERLIL